MKLFKALNDIWDAFVDWVESIGEDVMEFTKPLAKEIAKNGGKLLIAAAKEAVIAAEANGGSGSEKFKTAQNMIIETMKTQGVNVVMNAVNGAIENAVAGMNDKSS